ncbi:unnamed protein product [Lactuca saligna]|uniref:Uncharacterized protein n=1 Tax=Lactuca saligna TaxID=75948 RepID=A0AA35UQS6_LACSI|nr:unnamed protein product [Lactuca saligna]
MCIFYRFSFLENGSGGKVGVGQRRVAVVVSMMATLVVVVAVMTSGSGGGSGYTGDGVVVVVMVMVEEPICEDIDGQQSVRIDEFKAFIDDYSTYADFDVEYSVRNGEDNQVEIEILKGMVSDDSGDAFYSQNGDGSDYSGDDSDDSDYIVHKSNLQFDMDVDMSEFQSVVDVDEH